MASVKELIRSFAGGEITPEMYGRLDNVKFQTGLALCRNAIVLPHGPVTKRSGLAWVNFAGVASQSVRVIPFAWSASQTMVLEFGASYIRFHTLGGTVLETAKTITGVTQASPGVVTSNAHGFSNGQGVYIDGVGGMTRLNKRYFVVANVTANTFTLQNPLTGANISTAAFSAYTSGGTVSRIYSIASPYAAADLFDLKFTQSADVITITHPSYATRELRRLGATNWTLTAPTLGDALTVPATPTVAVTTGVGTAYNKSFFYKVTAVSGDGLQESLPSAASASASNDLTLPGSRNTVSWTTTAGASTYRVYKAVNGVGRLYGYIAETSDLSFVDDNVTPDYSRNPPATTIRLDTATNYPSAVTYYEQRRVFGGTVANPQTIYATKSGTESNLDASLPSNAADALSFTIKAQQQNAIRHLVPLNDLLVLTAGGVWKVSSTNDAALTPTTISVRTQNSFGANNVRPLLTGSSCLYVEATGRRVRDVAFQWERQIYAADDRSIMAPHLFLGYTLNDATYSRSPDQVAWFVRSDGALLGMTYVPEHQVFGWHQHTTAGTFESCCVVTENNEDVLYVVVRRTLNGTVTRTIERMATRMWTAQADAFYVDCGFTYVSGSPTTTVPFIDHLEGVTVSVLADGAVVSGLTVTNGAITLPSPATKVQVGLGYTTDVQTLPLALQEVQAVGQGTMKSVDYAYLRVYRTGILKVGPAIDRLTTFPPRTNENYDTPPRLRSEMLDLLVNPDISQDAQLWIQSSDPTPLTVSALAMKVMIGG
jgi:hypothetical protein